MPISNPGLSTTTLSSVLKSSSNINYWVSVASGSDTNPGTEAAPFQTIKKALNSLPHVIDREHTAVIRLFAGVYDENLSVVAHSLNNTAVRIEGIEQTVIIPSTGVPSGTINLMTQNTASVYSAGWTPDELKGRFMNITAGIGSGNFYPIAGNGADYIELCLDFSALSGSSFRITEPAAIIRSSTSNTLLVSGVSNSYYTVELRRIQVHASGTRYPLMVFNGGCYVNQSKIVCSGSVYAAYMSTDRTNLYAVYSTLLSTAVNGGGINCAGGSDITLTAVHIANTTYSGSYGINSNGVDKIFSSGVPVVEGFKGSGGVGFSLTDGNTVTFNDRFVIRKCNVGMSMGPGCAVDMDDFIIEDCASHGLSIGNSYGGYSTVDADGGMTIRNCGGSAVKFEGPGNCIHGLLTLVNNSGYAINMASGPYTTHGSTYLLTGTIMSGNLSGDILLGSGTLSLSSLQSDSDKIVIDTEWLNRISHQ